ncbi:MAG: 3D domain-containing protein [Gemmatimonadaceae bacterium]
MKRGNVIQLALALVVATIFIQTGAVRLPIGQTVVRHSPVAVFAEPLLDPLVVTARKVIQERGQFRRATAGEAIRMRAAGIIPDPSRFARAGAGEEIPVSLTQYCLQGTTRRGRFVRPGIVAADPRIFPLSRYVEVFMGKKYIGRFLVDDTGGNVIGATLDIWTPSCREATRFGRQHGKAVLVARETEHLPFSAMLELDLVPDLSAVSAIFEAAARRETP